LLLHGLTLLGQHDDVREEYQRRFRFILVDEYQDTNVAQYLWLRLLAQRHRNLCCVGDDDQSIYSWRGAEVANILRFEKDFPGAKIVRLEQNYRSTGHILAAAAGLIAHNRGRLGKTLWTAEAEGEKVLVRGVWDGEAEARFVGETIEALRRGGASLGSMAVLVRAGFQTREFEERFIALGLAYRVIGGPRFYERQEVRDAIAYLRVTVQPADDLAFERIINTPRRGIGDATLQLVHRLARARSIPMVEAARELVASDELKAQARAALRRLVENFARWSDSLSTMAGAELAELILDESGYTAMWQADRSPDAPGRLENLKELIHAIEEFESLGAFLEHVSLVMEAAEGAPGDMVSLMTLHSAKGLEFDTVFLPGWEEGLLPHPRAMEEGGDASLEEERRLAHVGLTRARQRALISFTANRRIHNLWQSSLPSRFIAELPAESLDVRSEPGLWRGAEAASPYSARWDAGPVVEMRASRPVGSIPPGARVFHQKFGYGRVVESDSGRLDIDFEKAGRKKVIESFVDPA
jgi:DNA helicase-2/ATP-dependent DNA helicase PcrA